MAGGVAHDFNNTLAVIIGVADSMFRHARTEDETRQAKLILHAARVASGLTEKLVTFSRGRPLVAEFVKPAAVIENVAQVLQQTAGIGKRLVFDIDCKTVDILIPGVHLEQILLNLVTNATAAIEGTGEINIRLSPEGDDRICLVSRG